MEDTGELGGGRVRSGPARCTNQVQAVDPFGDELNPERSGLFPHIPHIKRQQRILNTQKEASPSLLKHPNQILRCS